MVKLHYAIPDTVISTLNPLHKSGSIGLVSAHPGDCDEKTSWSFARTVAVSLSARVVVVDADFVNPSFTPPQSQQSGLKGFNELLVSEDIPVDEALYTINGEFEAIHCRSAGTKDLSALTRPDMGRTIRRLSQRRDYVIIKLPPASLFPGIGVALSWLDSVIMVVNCGVTRWEVAEDLKQKIVSSRDNLLGVLMSNRRFYIPRWLYHLM